MLGTGVGVKVAVPVTVPEGWVGWVEERVRVNVQGVVGRCVKRVCGIEEGLWVLVGEGGGWFGRERGVQDSSWRAGFLGAGRAEFVVGVDIRTLFTLWRVARLGFRAGLLVVIQLRRCLMRVLLMSLISLAFRVSAVPSSLTYKHR